MLGPEGRLRKSRSCVNLYPMRRFMDRQGREWEAVLGRGSWGLYLLLFAPTKGPGVVREAPLRGTSYEEALLELDALDDQALESMLARSTPKQD